MKTFIILLLTTYISSTSANYQPPSYCPTILQPKSRLHTAIKKGKFKKADKLIEKEEQVYWRNQSQATTLHMLALSKDEQGSINFLDKILKYNIWIDTPDAKGNTALFYALRLKKYRLAQAFISRGAFVDRENREGHNALYMFLRSKLDLENQDAINTLNLIISEGRHSIYKDFLNGTDIYDNSVLYLAVASGHLELTQFLVWQEGIDINLKNFFNHRTPLSLALKRLSQLISRGKARTLTDEQIYKIERSTQIANILLTSDHPLDLTTKDNKDKSSLDYLSLIKAELFDVLPHSHFYNTAKHLSDSYVQYWPPYDIQQDTVFKNTDNNRTISSIETTLLKTQP